MVKFLFLLFADSAPAAAKPHRTAATSAGSVTARAIHRIRCWRPATARAAWSMCTRPACSNGWQHRPPIPANSASSPSSCTPKSSPSTRWELSIYVSIYLAICLYCLPTNLFLFISLYFSHLALFGFVCIDWRLYSGVALTSPALSGAVSAARCSSTVPQHCVSSGRCVCSSSGPQTMSSVDWLVCISSLATPLPLAHCLLPPVVHDSTELHLLSHSQIGLSGQSWALSPWDSLAALSSCTFSARPICISAIAGRHATGRCPGQQESYWRLFVIWETKWKTR